MYKTAFPHLPYCCWSEWSCSSPKSEVFDMDFARAMFNFRSKGSLLECDTSVKEMDTGIADIDESFMREELSDLCEFSEDNIATSTPNAEISMDSSLQSSGVLSSNNASGQDITLDTVGTFDTTSTPNAELSKELSWQPVGMLKCSNASVHDNALETVGMFNTFVERRMDTHLPSVKDDISLDWLSDFGEDTLIYGASSFGVDSFLLNPEDVLNCRPASPCGGVNRQLGDQEWKDFQLVKFDGCRRQSRRNCGMFVGNAILPAAVPGRARSKRPRTGGPAAWTSPLAGLRRRLSPTNSSDSTSNAFYSKSSVSCPAAYSSGLSTPIDDMELEADIIPEPSNGHADKIRTPRRQPMKRKRNKGQDSFCSLPRRCTHCASQKTPQWRLGPTGPKTLCNACGVRFKSGRLFPEYMPAKSPTFLSHKHSNSHKKVLEIRRRQEMQKAIQQDELESELRFKLPRVDGGDHSKKDEVDAHRVAYYRRDLTDCP